MSNQQQSYILPDDIKNIFEQALVNLQKENFKLKQNLREKEQINQAEKEQIFLDLLEIFDALEFLINYLADNPNFNEKIMQRLPRNINNIQQKLLTILERQKVNPINFENSQPDFKVCQVIDQELRDDLDEKIITKIVRQGFKLEEKLLRPVEVIISKKPS